VSLKIGYYTEKGDLKGEFLMKAHMTNGTIDFLFKLAEKHAQLTIYLMVGDSSTLAYYEDHKKSIFAAGRSYDILLSSGDIQEEGYIAMNNIPVADEAKPIFETSFDKIQKNLDTVKGFQAFRLLKPLDGNTYIFLTQWASGKDYEAWKNSDAFSNAQEAFPAKQPAYFMEQPFLNTYAMYDPDDEDDNI